MHSIFQGPFHLSTTVGSVPNSISNGSIYSADRSAQKKKTVCKSRQHTSRAGSCIVSKLHLHAYVKFSARAFDHMPGVSAMLYRRWELSMGKGDFQESVD